MDGVQPGAQAAPAIELRQLSVDRLGETGRWGVRWVVTNLGTGPLSVSAARVPHGQFKAAEQRFEPAVTLEAGRVWHLYAEVACAELPGLVTENAFVIFQVTWSGKAWRIFVRISVVVDDAGAPRTKTESITTQEVGFSGMAS